jgi:lipopolysaccharide assembly outer membrane protein LptD (OstA)
MHTIEPMVAYTYIPRVNQSLFPLFDEVDRIPFTNQITYGVTQRLLGKGEGSNSGPVEYGKLIISQSYSLEEPSFLNPLFTDSEGKRRSFSNIRGELWLNFKPYLWAHWDAELNPYRGSFDSFDFSIIAKDKRNDAISVQYRNTRGINRNAGGINGDIQEINLLARVKTIPDLFLFGGYYYNLLEHTWVLAAIGAEYQAQCWSAGFTVEERNKSSNGTLKKETRYLFYVTLLNFGSVGHKRSYMNF